jgi:diphosphomevalonate decarboxylase
MKTVISRSPVNIALIKYWGKANPITVLPTTTSVSLTLTDLWTETSFTEGPFSFSLDGRPGDEKETARVKDVLKHFHHDQVVIQSKNNFPTASGLASSASGFAALTVGLNTFFQSDYSMQELANLTRLGSGSACRSLVDDFAIWHRDGRLTSISNPFRDLRMIIVLISEKKKTISSREAMQLTQSTSPVYAQWVKDSEEDYQAIIKAIESKDFHQVGLVMERNSERLHTVMTTSQPPIVYQQQASLDVLSLVKDARKEGLVGYATMDAGPNVKILIQGLQLSAWEKFLKPRLTHRYLLSRIGGKAHAE